MNIEIPLYEVSPIYLSPLKFLKFIFLAICFLAISSGSSPKLVNTVSGILNLLALLVNDIYVANILNANNNYNTYFILLFMQMRSKTFIRIITYILMRFFYIPNSKI